MGNTNTKKGRPVATYDHYKSAKKNPVRRVIIPLDDELAEQWQEVTGRLGLAQTRLDMGIDSNEIRAAVMRELAEWQAKKDQMMKEMEGNVAIFKVKGLGRKKYDKFMSDPKYMPTEAQLKKAKERNGPNATLNWNADTFPVPFIHACLVEPEMTLEEVQDMWDSDEWTSAECLLILGSALEANDNVRSIDWGKG
jgi:hypothetical protein